MFKVLAVMAVTIGVYGQSTVMGSRTVKGDWDASNARTTKPAKMGTAMPAECATGELFFKTDAAGGENLFLCKPDNQWTQMTAAAGSSTTQKLAVFDGSTMITGETMSGWSCGSGANCTTQWTVPAGVRWVRVQMWSGGGGGGGSTAGVRSSTGGSGGGYADTVCVTNPGEAVTIAVGLGGDGLIDGSRNGNPGGNSSFGDCIAVTGGGAALSGGGSVAWPGRIANQANFGYYLGTTMRDPSLTYCSNGGPGPSGSTIDQGGCGAGQVYTSGNSGYAGGSGFGGGGGGGSGAYNGATYGPGGTSALGGAGGHGGGWTAAGGLIPCSAGNTPGGGGGAAGAATSGNSNYAGCQGGRGEVRVYYIR